MKLIVKTLLGVESLLADEVKALGATDIEVQRRALTCRADVRTMYRICYESRFAMRVLMVCVETWAANDRKLYDAVRSFPWREYIDPDCLIYIDHITFSTYWRDSKYLALKTKDAIVDDISEYAGRRPSVDNRRFDVLLNVHASDDEGISVALDATNISLNKRGYRPEFSQLYSAQNEDVSGAEDLQTKVAANATNEVLAAALVELSGWTPDQALCDPMCGAGTILLEAAMKARHIPAQKYRKDPFGFQKWLNYDRALFEEVKAEADAKITADRLSLYASDSDVDMIDCARHGALLMGLRADMRIMKRGYKGLERPTAEGMIITCPPTEERRRTPEEEQKGPVKTLDMIYNELAFFLAQKFPDYDAWLYSTNIKALNAIELKPEKSVKVYNISEEGHFRMYPL